MHRRRLLGSKIAAVPYRNGVSGCDAPRRTTPNSNFCHHRKVNSKPVSPLNKRLLGENHTKCVFGRVPPLHPAERAYSAHPDTRNRPKGQWMGKKYVNSGLWIVGEIISWLLLEERWLCGQPLFVSRLWTTPHANCSVYDAKNGPDMILLPFDCPTVSTTLTQ